MRQVRGGSYLEELEFDGSLKHLTHDGDRTQEQEEKARRVQAVFQQMEAEDAELLTEYLIAQRPLREMAREAGVSRQAMHKRVQKAKRAFVERWLGLPQEEEMENEVINQDAEVYPFDDDGNLLPGWMFSEDGAVVPVATEGPEAA